MSWLAEGVAKRTMFGHPNPVIHLMVTEQECLWCSGGPAREFSALPHEGLGGGRACRKCKVLAREAVAEQMLDAADFPRFTDERSS